MKAVYQGDTRQDVAEQNGFIFLNGIRIPINDSTAAPVEIIDANGTVLSSCEIRPRSNGDLSFWNGTAWVVAGESTIAGSASVYTDNAVENLVAFADYEHFSDIPTSGQTAFVACSIDDSPNGDGTFSLFFRFNGDLYYQPTIKQ